MTARVVQRQTFARKQFCLAIAASLPRYCHSVTTEDDARVSVPVPRSVNHRSGLHGTQLAVILSPPLAMNGPAKDRLISKPGHWPPSRMRCLALMAGVLAGAISGCCGAGQGTPGDRLLEPAEAQNLGPRCRALTACAETTTAASIGPDASGPKPETVHAEGTLVDLREGDPLPRLPESDYLLAPGFGMEGQPFGAGRLGPAGSCLVAGGAVCEEATARLVAESCLDHQDFYSIRGMVLLGGGLGLAAILANTSMDRRFQNWHDERVRTSSTNEFAGMVKWFGEGEIMIPVVAGSALLEPLGDADHPGLAAIGQWGSRCSRSLLVGTPPLLALKYYLNGARPEDEFTSRWRPLEKPFSDGAVSGHAFVGAVPFLNAAMMTDDPLLKGALYGCSFLPGWSRVNDRRHYLSQALLGWYIAFLSADVVHRTEVYQHKFVVLPRAAADGFGVDVEYRY